MANIVRTFTNHIKYLILSVTIHTFTSFQVIWHQTLRNFNNYFFHQFAIIYMPLIFLVGSDKMSTIITEKITFFYSFYLFQFTCIIAKITFFTFKLCLRSYFRNILIFLFFIDIQFNVIV